MIPVALRELLDDDGLLPPQAKPHMSSLEEIEQVFVVGAPFEERRRLVFRALAFYSELLWRQIPGAKLWIDGGFTTLKSWGPPNDVDIVVVVPANEVNMVTPDFVGGFVTLQDVNSREPKAKLDRVQPFGGLIDAFLVAENDQAGLNVWHGRWSAVKLPDGNLHPTRKKGFVEVTRP